MWQTPSGSMEGLPELLVSALAPASLYALIAVGFVIIYKATRVVNFLQGQFAYLGALIMFSVMTSVNAPFLISVGIALGIALVIGSLVYVLTIRPLTGQGILIMIMLTLVLGTAVLNGALSIVWPFATRTIFFPLPKDAIALPGGAYITAVEIAIVLTALVVIGGIALALRYSRIGIQMRAAAENVSLAGYCGVNVVITATLSWALAAATAFLGGIGDGTHGIYPTTADLGLLAFPALLIGGMDSIGGVLVGSYVLSLFQQVITTYVSAEARDASAFVLLLVVLMVKPHGFFGTRAYRRL